VRRGLFALDLLYMTILVTHISFRLFVRMLVNSNVHMDMLDAGYTEFDIWASYGVFHNCSLIISDSD
jgi:hypothetical protein